MSVMGIQCFFFMKTPRARFTNRTAPTPRHGPVFTNAAHLGKAQIARCCCASRLIHMDKWEGLGESGCSLQRDGRRCVKCAYLCIPWWYLLKLPDEMVSLSSA